MILLLLLLLNDSSARRTHSERTTTREVFAVQMTSRTAKYTMETIVLYTIYNNIVIVILIYDGTFMLPLILYQMTTKV